MAKTTRKRKRTADPVIALLQRTRRVLQESGWCKGQPTDSQGRVDLETALARAADHKETPSRMEAYRLLMQATPKGAHSLAAYNDLPYIRFPRIERLIRRAIAARTKALQQDARAAQTAKALTRKYGKKKAKTAKTRTAA
jgi:hypothetical protein